MEITLKISDDIIKTLDGDIKTANDLFYLVRQTIMLKPFEKEAAIFCEAIKTIAAKPENLENFEAYLSIHFRQWLEWVGNSPENIAAELKCFAEEEI